MLNRLLPFALLAAAFAVFCAPALAAEADKQLPPEGTHTIRMEEDASGDIHIRGLTRGIRPHREPPAESAAPAEDHTAPAPGAPAMAQPPEERPIN